MGKDGRSALSAARSCGARAMAAWLLAAGEGFDRQETDCAKEDFARLGEERCPPEPWERAFAREASSGQSSFDMECAWLATRRWGAPAAARMWAACAQGEPSERAFSEWLVACAWGQLRPMPSQTDLAPWAGPALATRLGSAAALLCERERAYLHPPRVDSLLEALELCCSLGSASPEEAFSSFSARCLRWSDAPRACAAQALGKFTAAKEAVQIEQALSPAPGANPRAAARL